MSAFVPLLQTMLWVGLIVWLILRYHIQVGAVLTAIQERIIRGSSLKAGPFELGQDIHPQDIQEQNKRIEDEVAQLEAAIVATLPAPTAEASRRSNVSLRRRYLLAEDLAMRELQSEFGVVINRSVRYAGVQFDGMFAKDRGGFGVEVKYVQSRKFLERVVSSLSPILEAYKRLGWDRFTVLLALVCETDAAISVSDLERIQNHASELGLSIMIRVYTIEALANKFHIELQ